jgi:thioredoxin 1
MSEAIKTVTDTTFEAEVLASDVPVLVDYWAAWCAPCKMISPIVDQSAEEYSGQLKVAKLNIDENPEMPSRYHVRSIPTLMLFKGGKPVATKVGALNKSQLAAFIEESL